MRYKRIWIFILALVVAREYVNGQSVSVNFNNNTSFSDVLNQANRAQKLVFVDFFTTWCGPCKKMDKEVFTQSSVADLMNGRFVSMKIDAEKGEGIKLSQRYRVTAYPTFVVLTPDGKEVFRMEGAMPPTLFIEALEKGLDKNRSPDLLAKRYDAGERSPQLINDYAFSLMREGREDEGYVVVNKYFNSLSKKKRTHSENAFLYDRYTLHWRDEKAIFLFQHKNQFIKNIGYEETMRWMHRLLRSELITYVSGYRFRNNSFEKKTYERLRFYINRAEFSDSLDLKNLMRVAEVRVAGDLEGLIRCYEQVFPCLDPQDRIVLLINFSEFQSAAPAIRVQATDLLQQYIGDVPAHSAKIAKRILLDLKARE